MTLKKFAIFIFVSGVLIWPGCSEKKAENIYEIGQFEELQNNLDHARELYADILRKYPETDVAKKAAERLGAIDSIEQSTTLNSQSSNNGGQTMQSQPSKGYSPFDQPEIITFLFHPRKDAGAYEKTSAIAMNIAVDDNVTIGAHMHVSSPSSPTILFFHGNGEIVSDYDDLGPVYNQNGINFLVVDYRGYGRSTGLPTVSDMMNDAHAILKYARQWLKKENFSGPLIVMGRSLGSASALELAANCSDGFDGLIIESGFAYAIPLLNLLGVNTDALNISENNEFDNIHKIKQCSKPTLIIHAEFDHIIPYTDGKALFDASPAPEKKLLKIPQADHNTIFSYGMSAYMNAVKDMVSSMM